MEINSGNRNITTPPVNGASVTKNAPVNESPGDSVSLGGRPVVETTPPPPVPAEAPQVAPPPQYPQVIQVKQPDGSVTTLPVTFVNGQMVIDTNPDILARLLAQTGPGEAVGFVNPLKNVPPLEMSPLGDFLNIKPEQALDTLVERQPAIYEYAVHHRKFSKALDDVVSQTVTVDGKTEKKPREDALKRLQSLENFLVSGQTPNGWKYPEKAEERTALDQYFHEPPPTKLYPDEVTAIVEGFKDAGGFPDVVRFYEAMRARSPHLSSYDVPREYYVVALNKCGGSKIKDSIRESEAMIADRVQSVHTHPMSFMEASRRNVYRDLGINGEILSGTAKAYKNIHTQAEKQIDGMVSEANFAKLFSEISTVPLDKFSINGRTAGEIGTEKSTAKFLERVVTLKERSPEPGSEKAQEKVKNLVEWLESSTGLSLDKWADKGGDAAALTERFQQSDDPIALAQQMSGRNFKDWALTNAEVTRAASAPFDELAGSVARGKTKSDELMALGRQITGGKLNGPIINATFRSKVDGLSERVTRGGTVDAELVGFVSKASSSSIGRNLLDLSRKSLEISRDYYMAGFGVDFEYYPGVNVVYNEFALGNSKTAEMLIPLVQYAVAREGGATSTDYWNLATQVELAGMGNQDQTAYDLLPRVFKNAKVGWELGTSADNLEKLSAQRKQEGGGGELLSFIAGKFRERIAIGFPPPANFKLEDFVAKAQQELSERGKAAPRTTDKLTPEQRQARQVTDEILKKSKSFADAFNSKFVGGSWAFVSKGGVADTTINRPTVRALRQVNTHLGLDKLDKPSDFPVFSERMHRYIDTKFALVDEDNQRPMEDLHSDVHKKRDKFTENRHEYCQSRVSGNGRTNLVTEIMLGQSDCRHTDATYQASFDLWKRDHQTRELQSCLDAIVDGHEETFEKALERVASWNQIQVVSMDVAFHAPVQAEVNDKGELQKYAIKVDDQGKAVRTPDGQLLIDPKTNKPFTLEDHSMPFLLRLDPKGETVTGMKAVDPFYRGFWNVGNEEVDPTGVLDKDKGFYLGKSGTVASDGKPVDLYATQCGYSGRPLQKVPGECGQVTMGGLEYALNDLAPLLSDDNKLTHIVDGITGMVTGTTKERVLNAVMTRMLDESAADAHNLWKSSQDRKLTDPHSPFLGWAKEQLVASGDLDGKTDDELRQWLQGAAPEGANLPDFKLEAIRKAPAGSVIFDPHYLSYGEMLDQPGSVRLCGEVAVAPLALSLYLQDFRHHQDMRHVLDNMLDGKDPQGLAELEKIHRVGQLSAQLVVGERGQGHTIDILKPSGEKTKLQARQDFKSWHSIQGEDAELAALDAYTLKPAAEWLLGHLNSVDTSDGAKVLGTVVEELIEAAAADAHNVGWKASKDRALEDHSNPFVGWASKRQRISSTTPQLATATREEIATHYKLPLDQVSEDKAQAIRTATKDAVEKAAKDGKDVTGGDVTHNLYKEYTSMLKDQADGGTRAAGANAVPLLVLALYLSDFRSQDTATVEGLKDVIGGLVAGTDKQGMKDVTMLNHVAFQAAQLPYGERAEEREVAAMVKTGESQSRAPRPDIRTAAQLPEPLQEDNAARIQAGAQWMRGNLGDLVAKTS